MIAVIFEVLPAKDKMNEYLEIASVLRPELAKMEGFISIERFQSMSHPGKILSLSYWTDEKSVSEWRNLEMHRAAQSKGRTSIFEDYRLRVAAVIRDYGMFDRSEAPDDSKSLYT